MNNKTRNTAKKAMNKLQEAMGLLEEIKGENENIDETADAIGYAFADLEFEVNS